MAGLSVRRKVYILVPGIQELNFIPEDDRVGRSASPEGFLTAKIFKYERNSGKARSIYSDVLEQYHIDSIVLDSRTSRTRNISYELARYFVCRDWNKLGAEKTCVRHRIHQCYSRKEAVEYLAHMFIQKPLTQLEAIKRRVEEKKSMPKRPSLF